MRRRLYFYYLAKGVFSVGRQLNSTIRLPFSDIISRNHLEITSRGKSDLLRIIGRNGAKINNNFAGPLTEYEMSYGDIISVNIIRFIWLKPYIAVLVCDDVYFETRLSEIDLNTLFHENMISQRRDIFSGRKNYSILPWNVDIGDERSIEIEAPPQKKKAEHEALLMTIGPSLTMSLPMLLGFMFMIFSASGSVGGSFMYIGLITSLGSAIVGAAWAYINRKGRHIRELQRERHRKTQYCKYIDEKKKEILEREKQWRNLSRLSFPSVSEYVDSIRNSGIVWNRSDSDKYLYHIRIGEGTLPFPIEIRIPKEKYYEDDDELLMLPGNLKRSFREIRDVPVCMDLLDTRICGVISSSSNDLKGLLRIIALQIAFSLSYEQVCLVFVFSNNQFIGERGWIKWLPHIRTPEGFNIAFDTNTSINVLRRLNTSIIQSDEKRIIIFTDDSLIMSKLQREEDKTTVFVFGNSYEEMPVNCRSLLSKDSHFSGWIKLSRNEQFRHEVHYEGISKNLAVRFSRLMSSYCNAGFSFQDEIPDYVTIFDLLGDDCTNTKIIKDNWNRNRADEGLCIGLGKKEHGNICYLDFHESQHGPHGLIAGMTGSGKSEILQTIIISLAYTYSPYEVGFFLIDYKGGGMAYQFGALPHLMGSISNLSGNMISRSMISIKSENERRQRLFLSEGVNRIGDYQRLYYAGKVKEPLPHIFIIIDEFAELKKNEPEFMQELVTVAQVGRSLGVHLLLATQKPSGTVDENIWSNSKFRICLRVQDKYDSNEMLHKPDAAEIINPGRGYLQVGNDEVYSLFQGAYTMAKGYGGGKQHVIPIDGNGHQMRMKINASEDETAKSQIDQLISSIDSVFREGDEWNQNLSKLWCQPLPSLITADKLITKSKESYKYPVGIFDYIRMQKQGQYYVDLMEGGHHAIFGVSGSGKSTFLETFLLMVNKVEDSNTVNYMIVDFGRGTLKVFETSPLCSIYIDESREENLSNLFCFLKDAMSKRSELLNGINYAGYIKKVKAKLPLIILVIDNYGSFREALGMKYDSTLLEILRNGEKLGIICMISANAIGNAEVPQRHFDFIKTGIAFHLNDRYLAGDILRSRDAMQRLLEARPGSGLVMMEGEVMEFQCAISADAASDMDRRELIRKQIAMYSLKSEAAADMVPIIPDELDFDNYIKSLKMNGYITKSEEELIGKGNNNLLPVGYETESGRICEIDINKYDMIFLAGRRKSGKSNCLNIMRETAEYLGIKCLTVSTYEEYRAELNGLDEKNQKLLVFANTDILMHVLDDSKGNFKMTFVLEIHENDIHEIRTNCHFEEIMKATFGICLGGALEKQRLFDFSGLPYNELSKPRKAGYGIVYDGINESLYREIVIPIMTEEKDK